MHLFRIIAGLTAAVFVAMAGAQGVTVTSQPTDVTSNAELMISYRHQEHLWQTPDGSLHLLVNRGTLRPNPGLVLFSSVDGGVSWLPKLALGKTNRDSTADGQLDGTTLSVVFAEAGGGIAFDQMSYDATTQAWTLNRAESVFRSSGVEGENPTVAFDDAGVAWCTFAATASDGTISLMWAYRPTEGTWLDTGRVVGPTNTASKEQSGRPVRIPGGMGLIYRTGRTTYWTTRPNSADPAYLSDPVVVHVGAARAARNDPYATHYSVVADDAGHLHLAIADDGAAIYARYSMIDGTWSTPRNINADGTMSYLQIGLANGQVGIALSASRGKGAVYVSNDYGDTFTDAFALKLPDPADGISYKTGRVETATRSSGPLAVLQQYEDHRVQRLMVYQVPAP